MPLPGYLSMTITPNARKAVEQIAVAMTVQYKRRFTISEALIKAAEDITREATLASSEK
jgi:hypothetical protein